MRQIVIGTPWTSAFMHTGWVDAALALRSPAGYSLSWIRGLGWCDARRATYIIEKALQAEADIIAFIDGDVVVPPEWLESCVKHIESGLRVISAVVPMRGRAHDQFSPFEPMAWNVADGKLVPIDLNGGVQKIEYASFGAIAFDASVFHEVPQPWTVHEFDAKTYKAVGGTADSRLLTKLRQYGIEAHADPAIEVKHLHTFPIDRTYGERFPEWAVGPI